MHPVKPVKLSLNDKLEKFKKAQLHKVCLHPDAGPSTCSKGIIGSHTVQKGRSLEKLAEVGEVLSFDRNPTSLKNSQGQITLKRIHINNASTINAFCHRHDSETFKPIETSELVFSDEQCFLFGYRAVCLELHAKRGVVKFDQTLSQFADERLALGDGAIPEVIRRITQGHKLGLRDLENLKQRYDVALKLRDYATLSHYVIEFDDLPCVMCCGGITPSHDFNNLKIQSLSASQQKVDSLTLTVIATERGGAAVLTWLEGHSKVASRFVESLDRIDDHEVSNAIFLSAFSIENLFISPRWWQGQSERLRRRLLSRFKQIADITKESPPLLDPGQQYVNWKVSRRLMRHGSAS